MSRDRFRRAGLLHRGYHPRQVEAFLHHVETSMGGALPPISANDVRRAGFEPVRNGYDVDQVDAYLDALEEQVLRGPGGARGRRGRPDPAREVAYLRGALTGEYLRRFPRARALRRGYHLDDVDELVDRVVAALDGAARLGAEDVRRARFRPQRGGYREDAVDDALDRVVEHLLLGSLSRRPAQPTG